MGYTGDGTDCERKCSGLHDLLQVTFTLAQRKFISEVLSIKMSDGHSRSMSYTEKSAILEANLNFRGATEIYQCKWVTSWNRL